MRRVRLNGHLLLYVSIMVNARHSSSILSSPRITPNAPYSRTHYESNIDSQSKVRAIKVEFCDSLCQNEGGRKLQLPISQFQNIRAIAGTNWPDAVTTNLGQDMHYGHELESYTNQPKPAQTNSCFWYFPIPIMIFRFGNQGVIGKSTNRSLELPCSVHGTSLGTPHPRTRRCTCHLERCW